VNSHACLGNGFIGINLVKVIALEHLLRLLLLVKICVNMFVKTLSFCIGKGLATRLVITH